MAITRVQETLKLNSANGTSISHEFGSAPTSGNILIAIVTGGDDVSTAPSGWSQFYKATFTTGDFNLRVFYWREADGTAADGGPGNSLTWTFASSDGYAVALIEYSGLDTTAPFDVGADAWSSQTDVSSQTTGTTATTTQAEEVAVAMCMTWGPDYTASLTNTFSEILHGYAAIGGDMTVSIAEKQLSSTGTQETTFSGFTNDWAQAAIVTLKGASLTQVNKDLDLQWNTLATVSDDLDLQWALLEVVHGDMFDQIHDQLYFVYPEADVQWNVLTLVNDDLQLVWSVNQPPVGKDLDVQWNTLQAINDDLQLIWNVLDIGVVGNTLDLQWNVDAKVSDDLQLVWDTLAAVSDDLQLIWNLEALVTKDLDTRWDVLAPPGADSSSGFTIDPVNNLALSKLFLPYPKRVVTQVKRGVLTVTWAGWFWTTSTQADTLRDNLRTIVDDHQQVVINYGYDPTLDGTYWLLQASIRSVKRASGLYAYVLTTIQV